jgi:hypothetical protein
VQRTFFLEAEMRTSAFGNPGSRRASLRLALCLSCILAGAASGADQSRPYTGQPQSIPGRIQAELYDRGGPEVAFHDADAQNNGSGALNKGPTELDRFRQDEGVDISYTKKGIDTTVDGEAEPPGELYLGWTAPEEWVRYTVDVKQAGTYVIGAHLSSNNQDAQIAIAFGAAVTTGPIVIPSTGHWHRWRRAEKLALVRLEPGVQVMTLAFLKEGNMNVDFVELRLAGDAR